MDAFGSAFSAENTARSVRIEVFTSSFRVSGVTTTRANRVGDLLNQVSSTHLAIDQATLVEHGDQDGLPGLQHVLVPVEQVLFVIAPELDGSTRPEMQIARRATPVHLGLGPFMVGGELHVAPGAGSVEGLLNSGDRFIVLTGALISCRAHPELDRQVPAIGLQRMLAIMAISEEVAQSGGALADVLDAETAAGWLRKPDPG